MPHADPNCVFCKICAGQIPSERIFESDSVLAFLDINPLHEGHAVVVHRDHAATLDGMTPEAVGAVARVIRELAPRIAQVLGAPGYNVLLNNGAAAGQVVPHVHFHIVPRNEGDGLGYRWKAQPADPAQLAALGQRIRAAR